MRRPSVKENPDYNDPKLNTECGIYEPHCGLDNVLLSWGHDEYLYNVFKKQSTRESRAQAFGYLSPQTRLTPLRIASPHVQSHRKHFR